MMNTELVIVILIIAVSGLFTSNYAKDYNCQLLFIIGALAIVLIYKMLLYNRVNTLLRTLMNSRAGFTDFTTEINDFLNKTPSNLDDRTAAAQYQSELNTLRDKVDIMNEYLADLKTQLSAKSTGNSLTDQYNIQASQQVQDYRIRKLTEDIQRANDLIKESQLQVDSTKYKKIPVMSSCIVQQADGSVSVDTNLQKTPGQVNNIAGGAGNNITGTPVKSSQPGIVGSGETLPGSGDTNMHGAPATNNPASVQQILEYISKNGINVSLK